MDDKSQPLAQAQAIATQPRGWVFYDDTCGICSTWVPRWHGTLERIHIKAVPLQESWVSTATGLSIAALQTDLTLLLDNKRIYRGAAAYRWIAGQHWRTWGFWMMISIPPGRWLFSLLYRWFAQRRHRISQVCRITTKK